MAGNIVQDKAEAVFVAYGSNLSSVPATASQAFARVVKNLRDRGLIVNKYSRLWRSRAWPDPSDPSYINAVIEIRTCLNPFELLYILHEIEGDFGRRRDGKPYAPRVLDLDLIAYGQRIIDGESGLIVPHPRAHDRAFVMGPLSEIAPGWQHPRLQRSAVELYATACIGRDAHALAEDDPEAL
jgi:2-amino-4-hydroxy-6-hydroxymethyldihydropteridine diphosphokinase